jgi:N4-gp56 family major capsid protein
MSTNKFIPTIWSARILAALEKQLVYTKFFNRDYEGEIRDAGDTVKIGLVGAPTVKKYTKGADIAAPEDVTVTDTALSIDQADYFNIAVDDVDAAQSKINLLESASSQTGYAFGDVTDKYLAGLLVTGTGGTIGTKDAPKSITDAKPEDAYNLLVDLKVALDRQNCPTMGRICVVPPEFEGFMLKDSRFVAVATNDSNQRLTEGTVYKSAGFEIHVSNNAPHEDDGGSEGGQIVYDVIAGCDQSGTYAEQILNTEAYRPEKSFKDAVKGLHVYGAKVLRSACVFNAKVSF